MHVAQSELSKKRGLTCDQSVAVMRGGVRTDGRWNGETMSETRVDENSVALG